MIPLQKPSSSALSPVVQDSDATAARARNRRPLLGSNAASRATSPNASPNRGASPLPSARLGSRSGRNDSRYLASASRASSPGFGQGLFEGPWGSSWASVQGFAASLISRDLTPLNASGRSASRERGRPRSSQGGTRQHTDTWGPEPPHSSRPRLQDVAVGFLEEREAKLRAVRTASVLESHDGVNGGLDVAGKFKKRKSDEDLRDASLDQETEEQLVYIHHVQPDDTYAGIVLKYRCREDVFRKANGLWSRDSIQTRKWLAIPVDACEVRGRPCDAPDPADVRLVAPAGPGPSASEKSRQDFFKDSADSADEQGAEHQAASDEVEPPWTTVRWVMIDSFFHPVEMARMARKALGYFPPRRKKSMQTVSRFSTPRGSMDIPSISLGSEVAMDSPRSSSSRLTSLIASHGLTSGSLGSSHPRPGSARSRVGSDGDELKPAWMRRPGGVGSMGRNVRAPGPEKDYLNSWTRKHIPSLNIDSLPSMSIMGSETAHFGFRSDPEDAAGIVESSSEPMRDTRDVSRQGSGLDKAAAAIETWLRGALARKPTTPVLGPHGRSHGLDGDFIELTDTNSDEGPDLIGGQSCNGDSNPLPSAYGSSNRDAADGMTRERVFGGSANKKAD